MSREEAEVLLFFSRRQQADLLVHAISEDTVDIYHTAVKDKKLGLYKKGELDLKPLDDEKVNAPFREAIKEGYLKAAKKSYTIDTKGHKEDDMLLQTYTSTIQTEIEHNIREQGSNYGIEKHREFGQDLERKVKAALASAARAHIGGRHAKAALKITKSERIFNPKYMAPQDIHSVLEEYHQHGKISPANHKGKPYYIIGQKEYRQAA